MKSTTKEKLLGSALQYVFLVGGIFSVIKHDPNLLFTSIYGVTYLMGKYMENSAEGKELTERFKNLEKKLTKE